MGGENRALRAALCRPRPPRACPEGESDWQATPGPQTKPSSAWPPTSRDSSEAALGRRMTCPTTDCPATLGGVESALCAAQDRHGRLGLLWLKTNEVGTTMEDCRRRDVPCAQIALASASTYPNPRNAKCVVDAGSDAWYADVLLCSTTTSIRRSQRQSGTSRMGSHSSAGSATTVQRAESWLTI